MKLYNTKVNNYAIMKTIKLIGGIIIMEESKFIAVCCGKEVDLEEVILNHGLCDECMDKGSE